MLVEFRVKNFRSLRDEQVLSLVATKDKTWADTHTLETGLKAVPHLLKSAAIYGANASGKSNLLKALRYMRSTVVTSATVSPDRTFAVQPFRLDTKSSNQPTEFEVTFILDKVRYQYGFSMTQQRVITEHLLVYKAAKPQRWFTRSFDETTDKDVYEFGPGLKGERNVWKKATRSNTLFLSMAVQLNSEVLRPVYNWFAQSLVIVNDPEQFSPEFLIQMLKQPDGRQQIRDLLRAADISIEDIELKTRKVSASELPFKLLPELLPLKVQADKVEIRDTKVEEVQLIFSHITAEGSAKFGLMDESSGTRILLFLVGPMLDILRNGRTLVIDELDTSLHPLLVHELVRLFYRSETNPGGAQLIFTTHDASLLDADLLRRDQVWLVEKDAQQASKLVALSEFSPRKNEALERGYLMGRYGGIPLLDDSFEMVHVNGTR